MSTDFTDLGPVHNVADMSLETSLTTSHSSKDSLDTSSHDHMIFWVDFAAEQRANRNSVHWQLLLEVSNNLESLRIDDL